MDYNQFVSQYINQINPATGRYWTMDDIVKTSGLTPEQANAWLGQAQTANAVLKGGIPYANAQQMVSSYGSDPNEVYAPGYMEGLRQAIGLRTDASQSFQRPAASLTQVAAPRDQLPAPVVPPVGRQEAMRPAVPPAYDRSSSYEPPGRVATPIPQRPTGYGRRSLYNIFGIQRY